MDNIVAVKACDSYDEKKVYDAVKEGFSLLGGIEKFVKKGQIVALKVNLVHKASPEEAVTTHPSVVLAVAKLIHEAKADCFIVDSAGGAYNQNAMMPIYKASGMLELNEKYGIKINDNYDSFNAPVNGRVSKTVPLLDALEKADVIFNLCKLKTHGFTGISNAVKNMYGAIPGLVKVEYHAKFPGLDTFNDNLYDIHNYYGKKLCLHISDAIIGMEGAGPTHGTPRKIGLLLMSSNPACLDTIGCKLMNVDPKTIPTIEEGIKYGYLDEDLNIKTVGDDYSNFVITNYQSIKPNKYTPFASAVPKVFQKLVTSWMTQRPVIPCKKCKGCSKCFNHCPMKAIEMRTDKKGKKYAHVDYNKCIRCYCCQELCPFGVVKIKSGWIYKLRHRNDAKKNKSKSQ